MRKQAGITHRIAAPLFCPVVQMLQLYSQNGCLQRVQAAVHAEDLVSILAPAPVDAQQPEPVRIAVIIGGYHPAITRPSQILGGEKTEAAHRTDGSCTLAAISRADGLG